MVKEIMIKANIVSFLGLICAVVGMYLCYVHKVSYAVLLLAIAGIFDGFDGSFAKKYRKPDANPEYGVQLDSLIDIVSSGVFPIVVCFSLGFTNFYNVIFYIIFIICGITRLTYYNVNSSDKKYFCGLPITCSTFVIPIVYFITKNSIVYMISLLTLSILYISNIKISKPKLSLRVVSSLLGLIIIITMCYLCFKGIVK